MSRARSSSGIALVAVLWVVMLLAIIAAVVMSETHSAYRATRNASGRAAAEAIADAAINRAIADLMAPPDQRRWRLDGSPAPFVFEGIAVQVSVQDELGKIDLNFAPDELLAGLLRSAGVPPEQSDALVDAIADWRDDDDLRRLHGAETADYRNAGRRYVPRNGLFQTVEELRLVLGMTDAVFLRLEPALTVYSQNRGVDVATAPPAALRALPGMDANAVDQLLRTRAQQPNPLSANLAGRAFSIRAAVALPDGSRLMREAVVRPTFNPQHPVIVHLWRSRDRG